MDSNPEYSLSPEKLRVSYTLGSKSNKTISIKKPLTDSETRPETLTSRVQTSSTIPSSSVSQQLARLQDELDSDELAIALNSLKTLPIEQRLFGETLIYEKYIDKAINLLKLKDKLTGKGLFQAWNSFKTCTASKIAQITQSSPAQALCKLTVKDQSTQISDDLLKPNNKAGIETYINSLHRVIKGINQMQIEKIIEKLQELHSNMQPTDLPELSDTSEVTQIDFTDTLKSIHTRLKARVKPHETNEVVEKVKVNNAYSQTYINLEDFRYEEVYKILVLELENKVADLSSKLRKKEDVEDRLIAKTRECEEVRRKYIDVKTTSCLQCRVKRNLIDSSNNQIRSLEMTVEKGFMIEKELVKAKQQLAESRNIILTKDKKIVDLTANVDELSTKIKETTEVKENLEVKLETSTKELEKVIEVLENSEKFKVELETILKDHNLVNEELKKKIQIAIEQNHKLRLLDSSINDDRYESKATGIDFNFSILNNIHKLEKLEKLEKYEKIEKLEKLEKIRRYEKLAKQDKSESRKNNFSNSNRTPPPNSTYRSQFLTSTEKSSGLIRPDLFRIPIKKSPEGQKPEKKNIMNWLNLTKEEYLALSKKARLELYECLYEHKDKCGADCEHLRRAMLIRQKERGTLFPTKKYNIN